MTNALWDYCLANGWEQYNDHLLLKNEISFYRPKSNQMCSYLMFPDYQMLKYIEIHIPIKSQIKLFKCYMEVYGDE